MYTLSFFHYHLETGGITQVLSSSIRSMFQEAPEEFEVRIVCGRKEGSEQFMTRLREELPEAFSQRRISCELVEEIDYSSRMESPPEVASLKRKLYQSFSDSIWWVHNYHIGKNPEFTLALLELAEEHPEQKILFHIHDFPESGRFENLQKNRRVIRRSLYPNLPNVGYIVINHRDFDILQEAGIPESRLFLLNNPIDAKDGEYVDLWKVHDKINRWAADNTFSWQEGGKLILCPVRSIRRKNLLESAAISAIVESPVNLLITLPGVSEQERDYSDLLQRAFEEGLVSGAWGVGRRLDEFETSFKELSHAADLVLSSSIQEGFGYLFIDSLLWGVPLLARDLSVIKGIKKLFDPQSSHFYPSFLLTLDGPRKAVLGNLYREYLEGLRGLLRPDFLNPLFYEVEQILAPEKIDFSFLTPELQYETLQRLAESSSFREQLRNENAELAANAENLLRGPQVKGREKVRSLFGPKAHVAKIKDILEFFVKGVEKNRTPTEENPPEEMRIDEKVLRSFSHIDYFRPLYFK
ncbi:MAG TPA: hypothetical protein ENN41_02250 [Sediminispirochaeta sp.]|nr:hypothetical protein [Sediminispirochaeta sp.]